MKRIGWLVVGGVALALGGSGAVVGYAASSGLDHREYQGVSGADDRAVCVDLTEHARMFDDAHRSYASRTVLSGLAAPLRDIGSDASVSTDLASALSAVRLNAGQVTSGDPVYLSNALARATSVCSTLAP